MNLLVFKKVFKKSTVLVERWFSYMKMIKTRWRNRISGAKVKATQNKINKILGGGTSRPPPTYFIAINYCVFLSVLLGHMQSFYRSHQGFHSRSFSSMSHSYRSLSGTSFLRTMWNKEKLVFKRFASVYYLEERANSETDNPVAQAKYLAVSMNIVYLYVSINGKCKQRNP